MSTALLENSIVPGRNKIRTSPLDHFLLFSVQISIQRCLVLTWERPIWNQNKTTRVAEVQDLKTSTAQLDNSNALSPNKIKRHDHSSSILFYNIIIHFDRCSVSISPLTCLFYRREVWFTIHHKFLLVYIMLFQLSTQLFILSGKVNTCAIKLQFFPQVEPSKIGKDGLSSILLETLHISGVA